MNPREVYERNSDFSGHEEQFKLRPHEWEFYLRIDGHRSIQDIGHAARLDMQWVVPTVERLEQLALIRVVEIGMEEFYRRFVNPPAASAAPAATAAPAPPDQAASASAAIPTPAPPGAGDAKRVSFSLRRGVSPTMRHAAQPAPVPIPDLAAAPAPARVPDAEEFHLKPLLDFVIGQSGGGTVGQLAVYRVFLKVPNELLREAGIKSLKLFDADFTFRHAALRHALLAAVEEVVGRPYVPGTASQVPSTFLSAPTATIDVPNETSHEEPLAV